MSLPRGDTRPCVSYFFYDDKAMGTHITLSQLDAAAPEFSFPLGDKPVSQPALSQTLVGHSVIVVRREFNNYISSIKISQKFRTGTRNIV